MISSIWLYAALSLLSTGVSLRFLVPISHKVGLLDHPVGRKQHKDSIPLVGGLAAYLGVLVTVLFAMPLSTQSLFFFCGGTIVLLAGAVDDYKPLGVRVRLVIQLIAVGLVIAGTDLYVRHLPIPLSDARFDMGTFGIAFTAIAVIGLMNAFNLSDGIDGLAGSLTLVAVTGIMAFSVISGTSSELGLVIVLGAALLPYLAQNLGFVGKKVFLGDAGSMFIGFTLAWTLISQVEHNPPLISATAVLWCVAVPVIDTLGVMVRRVRKGHSPFKPDRDHLHHILQRAGLSTRLSLLVIAAAALVILAIGIVVETIIPEAALVVFASLFIIYSYCLNHAWKVQKYFKR